MQARHNVNFRDAISGLARACAAGVDRLRMGLVVLATLGSLAAAGLEEGTPYGWGPGYISEGMPLDLTNAVAIAAGQGFTVALRSDGTVTGWGVGFGGADVPWGLRPVVAISAGNYHALALQDDGRVVGWGAFGHVWRDTIIHAPEWLTNVVSIEAGFDHSLAVTSDGFVIGWGANHLGGLNVPIFLRDPVGLAAGQQFNLAILPDRSLFGWGINHEHELDFPPGLTNLVRVDASIFQHCLALNVDGRVFAWGNNSHGQARVPADLETAIEVAAGSLHSLALRPDGTVAAWGANGLPQAQPPPDSLRFFAIAAGYDYNVGLTRGPVIVTRTPWVTVNAGDDVTLENAVLCRAAWTADWRHNGTVLEGGGQARLRLTNAQAADAGSYTMRATNAFGAMEGGAIQLTVIPSAPRLLAEPESAAAEPGGTVTFVVAARGSEPFRYQWFREGGDALPGATNAILELTAVGAADAGGYVVVVSNDAGSVTSRPAWLSAGPPVIGVQPAGRLLLPGMDAEFTCELVSPGSVRLQWFRDGEPLDAATNASLRLPQLGSAGAGDYTLVASNGFGAVTSAVARLRVRTVPARLPAPGMVVGWGASWAGGPLAAPEDLTNAVAAAVGEQHALALRVDGSLTTWGNGLPLQGLLDIPADATGIVAVAAGAYHSLALRSDGTVRGWGATNLNFGQWSIPQGLTGVVEVAAGRAHSLALREEGSVIAWPATTSVPAALTNIVAIASEENACLALRADGTTILWWADGAQGARVFASDSVGIQSIAAARDYGLAGRFDGTVVRLGDSGPDLPEPLTDVARIDGATLHALAVRTDGTLVAWGADVGGNLLPPMPVAGVVAISASYYNNLVITRAPWMVQAPVDDFTLLGQAVHLEVAVRSTTPVTYQWRRDGRDIPDATEASFHREPATFDDQGRYDVVVSNGEHTVVSVPVVVGVMGEPVLTLVPEAQGGARMEMIGPIHRAWSILESSDLQSWTELEAVQTTDGHYARPLPVAAGSGAQFFRAVVW